MNKLNIAGNYVFPQAKLIQLAGLMVENMYRDEQEFLKIGLKAELFEEVKRLKNELEAIPSDFRLQALLKESSAHRNLLKKQLVQLIDEILLPIEFAYGRNSAAFGATGFKWSRMKNSIEHILQTSTDLYTRLTSTEDYSLALISKESIEMLKFLTDDLTAEHANYNALKTSKADKAFLRISIANNLYKRISFIAYYGKRIWMSSNPAYYKTYVLENYQASVQNQTANVA
ncbi:MAG TPA: hypothetical protein DCQ31_16210 [Bacteroidales bacterium]|nr:hypothetical protein [Bacteroidales bacterium]